jgi:hypothetical protein
MARTGGIDLAWTNVNDLAANARVLWREPLVALVAPEHLLAQTSGPFRFGIWGRIRLYTDRVASWML